MRRLAGRAGSAAVVDAVGVVALTLVAVTALAGTFDGIGYLLSALIGALLGVGAVSVGRLRHWPMWTTVLLGAAAFLLVAPVVAFRGSPTGALPTPGAWGELGRVLVHGWKDLLTTLPPVASGGRLLALTLFLGLVGGYLGQLLARGTRAAYLPIIGPGIVFVAAAALGTDRPDWLVLRGLLLAIGGALFATARRRRLVLSTTRTWRRAATGVLLIGATVAGVALAAPRLLPATSERHVLRDVVVPPLDLTDQPSPLAGFRTLTPARKQLADVPLLTVTGLPQGTPLRLAVLDSYGGSVWAAGSGLNGTGSGFLRIGSRVPTSAPGAPMSLTVTVERGYAAAPDLRLWAPTAGQIRSLQFTGDTRWERSEAVRYNPGTGAALVLGGLREGDRYLLEAVRPDPVDPKQATTAAAPVATNQPDEYVQVTAAFVESAAGRATDPVARIRATADRLKTNGTYTDGVGAEARYPAGHSIGRIATFLGDPTTPGNDEQYAATLALAAAQVGLPSRVVLVATPAADFVVRGRDVRAAVEVEVAPGEWWFIPATEFMPDENKKPKLRDQPQQDLQDSPVVPPPNARRPPSSTDEYVLDNSNSSRTNRPAPVDARTLPVWLRTALQIASVPAGLLALWAAVVLGLKALRSWRRGRRGPVPRVVGAWDEVIDAFRDHRVSVAGARTRREQARASGVPQAVALADAADALTFGPGEVSPADASSFAERAAVLRHEFTAALGWPDRVRGALSARSLLPDPVVDPGENRPSRRHADAVRAAQDITIDGITVI